MSITVAHISTSADTSGASNPTPTFPATTAGNAMLIVVNMRANSTDQITAITGLGTAARVTGSRAASTSDNRACEIWQCLNIPGGVTSANFTQSGTGIITMTFYELHSTVGSGAISFDAASNTTNAVAASSPAKGGAITTTGSSDFILSYFCASTFNADNTALAPLTTSTTQDNHGNTLYTGLNVTPQTYTPSVGIGSSTGAYNLASGAWKDATAAPARQPMATVA